MLSFHVAVLERLPRAAASSSSVRSFARLDGMGQELMEHGSQESCRGVAACDKV